MSPPLDPGEQRASFRAPTQSADSQFELALTKVLGKAQQQVLDAPSPRDERPADITFSFSGGGTGLIPPVEDPTAPTSDDPAISESVILTTTSDPQMQEIPFPMVIGWVHLWAWSSTGQPAPCTALIDMWITNIRTFDTGTGRVSAFGIGEQPSLVAQSSKDCILTGWNTNLDVGDALFCRLVSLTGTATTVAVSIWLAPATTTLGKIVLTDEEDNLIIDELGNRVVWVETEAEVVV